MRFCYLRLALLTSAIAANAFADTAETNVKLAASHAGSTFVRGNSASSGLTEMHGPTSADDEDRVDLTFEEFADLIRRSQESGRTKGMMSNFFKPILKERKTPKAVYGDLKMRGPNRNLFLEKEWIKWAYFVYQVGHQFEENEYEFVITAMSTIYDAEALFKILLTGVRNTRTRHLATNLAKESSEDVKHVFFQREPTLAIELFHKEQQTADTIYKSCRGRIFAYLTKHVRNNQLPNKEFFYLISYLSVLLNKKTAVGTTLSVSGMFSKDTALLEKLLSISNFYGLGCIKSLVSVWLDTSKPPSQIVSMLIQNKAEADQLTILFLNGPTRSFWLHYFRAYNGISTDDEFTRSANLDFEQVLRMVFAVVEQKAPATDRYIAKATILKMLISPSNAHPSSSQSHVMKLMSILLLDRTPPSDVLSMLMRGEADADKFNILFVNKESRNFWVRYLRAYYATSKDAEEFTRTANTALQRLLIILHDVEVPESSTASKYLAKSIILKILLSPAIANVVSSRKYLEEMTSNWLQQRLLPSAVVFMLVHDEAETNYFKLLFTFKPTSRFWMDYTNAFYADTPSPQNPIMSTLSFVFGDAKLKEILKKALTDEATREQAKPLLDQLNRGKHSLKDNSLVDFSNRS